MRTEGDRIIKFIESMCRHVTGPNSGEVIQLHEFQRRILRGMFEQNDEGLWRYRQAVILLPRKNGKSELLAAILIYLLVTTKEMNAQLYCAAGSREQAREVFLTAKQMIELEPELVDHIGSTNLRKDSIYNPHNGAILRRTSSDGKLQHGSNPYVAICDETWCYPDGELPEAFSSGMGARKQAMLIHITTPGAGEDSYLWDLVQYGKRVRAGSVDDPTFYLWWDEPPGDVDYRDPDVWRRYNPGYANGWIRHDFLEAQAKGQVHEQEFRRLHLAQWTAAKEAWLPYGAWSGLETAEPLRDGEPVWLGVDGSYSNDSTGIVAATADGRLFVLRHWEAPTDNPDWRVPLRDVGEAVEGFCDRYDVREVACDPYWLGAVMQDLEAVGVPVVEFKTNNVALMAPACANFYEAVMDGSISHDHSKRLAQHLDNCRVKSDRYGTRITKEYRGSPNKIDLAVCAVVAFDRARQAKPLADISLYF